MPTATPPSSTAIGSSRTGLIGMRFRSSMTLLVLAILAGLYLDLPNSFALDRAALHRIAPFLNGALHPAFVSQGELGGALLPLILRAALNTLRLAACATTLACVIGFLLAFPASSAWWESDPYLRQHAVVRLTMRSLNFITRTIIALLRSIHELLWAMLLLSAFGISEWSAILAIAIPYSATLAKIFSELIDEAPRDAATALRGMGAAPIPLFLTGSLPLAMPNIASYSFYRFECAIRSSAILGFFGFPTLGYYIHASFENLYYGEVWAYLYALVFMIVALDAWSGRLRQQAGTRL